MILNDIRVYFDRENKSTYETYPRSRCVSSMFLNFLGKLKNLDYRQINITITDKKIKDGKTENLMKGCLDYYKYLDPNYFHTINDSYQKKKAELDIIYHVTLEVSEIYNWNKKLFEDAYNKCLEFGLECQWYFKNKLFRSPNRKYHFGLFNIDDVDNFSIYEVVFDKNKRELARRLCFQTTGVPFYIEWASWEGQNDLFYYKFNGPKKIFEVKVKDLLEGKSRLIFENTSEFFKE
ncbi:MAG: hypothetical protein HC880_07125 [Bacteroidia bacterium]|nr:hypothetical protein [Bacteroidia bacterium]